MAAHPTPSELLAGAWHAAAAFAATFPTHALRPIAIGWATVELDRAVKELTVGLGLPRDRPFRPAPRSELLGARCLVAAGVLPDGGSLIALEPDTEGRLAGSLARFGEGPLAAWLSVSRAAADRLVVAERGLTVSPGRPGPLGVERLIAGVSDRLPERHRLLLPRAAGTIPP